MEGDQKPPIKNCQSLPVMLLQTAAWRCQESNTTLLPIVHANGSELCVAVF